MSIFALSANVAMAGADDTRPMSVPHRENHEEINRSALAATAAADRIAKAQDSMPVCRPEMRGSEVGRSAKTAVSDHSALNPKTLLRGTETS